MKPLLFIFTLIVSLVASPLTKAQKSLLEGNSSLASLQFHQEAKLNNNSQALFDAAATLLAIEGNAQKYIPKAEKWLDSLSSKLEPEDELFFPSLLLRSWAKYRAGKTLPAQKQFESAQSFLTKEAHPLSLWIGFQIHSNTDQAKALEYRKQLSTLYPKSPENLQLKRLGVNTITIQKPKEKTAPNSPPAPTITTTVQKGSVWLQLGAFGSQVNAQSFFEKINSQITKPYNCVIDFQAERNLYFVRVKGFLNKEKAISFATDELNLAEGSFLAIRPSN